MEWTRDRAGLAARWARGGGGGPSLPLGAARRDRVLAATGEAGSGPGGGGGGGAPTGGGGAATPSVD
ncbi:hypothetical protein THAOC_14282, partial [Thalassiosira oceanica]